MNEPCYYVVVHCATAEKAVEVVNQMGEGRLQARVVRDNELSRVAKQHQAEIRASK